MIKIGSYLINPEHISYVSIDPYPTEKEYIPSVRIEEDTSMFSKKIKKVRVCADCGDLLEDGEKYCESCYDNNQPNIGDTVIYIEWSHNELRLTEEDLTREEYDVAVKQLEALIK